MDVLTARQLLGVARGASEDEIKQAYRRLARQHHPDVGGDKETFVRIQEAYDLLSAGPAQTGPRPSRSPFTGDVEDRLAELRKEVEAAAQRARRAAQQASHQASHQGADLRADLPAEDSLGAVIRDAFSEVGKRLETLFEQPEGEPQTLRDRVKARLSDIEATPTAELSPAERELLRIKKLIHDVAERSSGVDL